MIKHQNCIYYLLLQALVVVFFFKINEKAQEQITDMHYTAYHPICSKKFKNTLQMSNCIMIKHYNCIYYLLLVGLVSVFFFKINEKAQEQIADDKLHTVPPYLL